MQDATLLEAANRLSLKLAVQRPRVDIVLWVNLYRGIGQVFPDQPVLRGSKLILNGEMREKLSREEWEPLVASSIIYDARFRRRRAAVTLAWLVPSLFALAMGVYVLGSIVGNFTPAQFADNPGRYRLLADITMLLIVGVFLVPLLVAAPFMKGLRFRADQQVCQELGMETILLQALEKVLAWGVVVKPTFGARVAQRPMISERIHHLKPGNKEKSS